MRMRLPPDKISLALTVIMAGLIAVGIYAEQAQVANTQEYQDNYGLEIPLNRALPPPTIQTIEITVETVFYLLGAFVGALWTLYSTLLSRINEISEASGDGEGKIDKRLDDLSLDLAKLQGLVMLLEERFSAVARQMESDKARSDRHDDWNAAKIREISDFLSKHGFEARKIEDQLEPPAGALRPPTPPPIQGNS